jgi:hypothetical protein
VSEAYCEGHDGYLFDIALHPPATDTEGGANLTVYTNGTYGYRFLRLNDFQIIPDGNGRVDIEYTGDTAFSIGIYEK